MGHTLNDECIISGSQKHFNLSEIYEIVSTSPGTATESFR